MSKQITLTGEFLKVVGCWYEAKFGEMTVVRKELCTNCALSNNYDRCKDFRVFRECRFLWREI